MGDENQYLNLLRDIMLNGVRKEDRTGTGTRSVFGRQLRFDLSGDFPLLTTKRIHLKSIIHELLWFIAGDTNIKYLNDNGVHIWDEWADERGDLGPVYGAQWRRWSYVDESENFSTTDVEIDQLNNVLWEIEHTPDSRRMIVNSWNVGELSKMKLPPCHLMFQFNVTNGELSCMMTQRSCDVFLGLPFNIATYALLTQMVAQVTNLQMNELVINLGDTHIYSNHFAQVEEQLTRAPRELPMILLNGSVKSLFDFRYEDFNLVGYDPHPGIKAPVAV